MAKVNLNRPFHAESLWDEILRSREDFDYDYDIARRQWRMSQSGSVIQDLASEYKKLRQLGIPHEGIDEACYDGYLEYIRRWPVKSAALRIAIAKINDPDAVSDRLNEVQPNDEVIKGDEAIERIPDELPALLDDSMIGQMIDEHADSMN